MDFNTGKQKRLPKVIGLFFICDVLIVVMYLGNHFINYPIDCFSDFLDINNINNLHA